MNLTDHRASLSRSAAALWLAATAYETLRPLGWIQPVSFWSFFDTTMASVDYVQNIVLFAPLGWIANRAGWSTRRTLLAAFAISACIEMAQHWVPGRASTAMDLVCDTAGAALGWWLATAVVRPRLRLGGAFAALAAFLGLHVLNTAWAAPAERTDGAGVWTFVKRESCAAPARASTVCISVPNVATAGTKYVRVVGPDERTYARVQSDAEGRLLRRDDCVNLLIESTVGARMRLRPPITHACGVADATDGTVTLRVDPRLEHELLGAWTPTRAGVWMWPVWPFNAYRPALLRAAGALAFVTLAALLMGAAPWVIPAGYLLMLELLALVAAMRAPGLWDAGWGALAWIVAMGLVAVDKWWGAARGRVIS